MAESPAPELPPRIIVVCSDLIFSTRITGTARALGQSCATVATLQRLEELLTGPAAPRRVVIVDMTNTRPDALEAIRLARRHDAELRIVAFLPHVRADLAAMAREAGAGEVMARSAFSERLNEVLS